MNKKISIILIALLVVLVGLGIWVWSNNQTSSKLLAQVTYICDGDKTINATFYKGKIQLVDPGQPPIPTGSVKIVLSDGRTFDLPQTISADGTRYANSDESFIFWGKGNGALVLENNTEKSYIGCIVEAKDSGELPNIYHDSSVGFSIRYPANYLVNTNYQSELSPDRKISGVKFTIPESITTGTNLSSDSGISVESIPDTQDCNANLFLYGNSTAQTITDNGVDYSFASSTDAAAGNRYEEKIWAMPGTNPCIAVRYFIHYGAIENYPQDLVQEFDKASLINQFDKIRQTLIIQ
jgi:membrane-bound inhibitor of C-type lysozyme